MRLRFLRTTALALTVVLAAGWLLYQSHAQEEKPLADVFPSGALLYLEARDLSAALHEWNASPEKKLWLQSDNHAVFSRSRLFTRLEQAQQEFAGAAGLPPDMQHFEQAAGSRSALAIYDIGKLQFLYVTRMASARALESELWQKRSSFEPRQAAGVTYYVRTDLESQRVVAFAVSGDTLLLATREDVIAGALTLLKQQEAPSPNLQASIATDAWYAQAVQAASQPGDLRLVLNMAPLVRAPHFRSYWVQQNITELGQYTTAVSDLYRSGVEYREERHLLRSEKTARTVSEDDRKSQETAVADLLRIVPSDAGLYRAWAAPDPRAVTDLLERKLLTPRHEPPPAQQTAPAVALSAGQVGSEADLETLLDEVPPVPPPNAADPVLKLMQESQLQAAMHVQSSSETADGVFVGSHSAVVLASAADWDSARVRDVLQKAAAPLWTTLQLGTEWPQKKSGTNAWYELNGLAPLAVAASGRTLIVSDSGELLSSLMQNMAAPHPAPPQSGIYAAGFSLKREQKNFVRMMSLIERPLGSSGASGHDATEPRFFSRNLGSLSRSLGRVQSESIRVRDLGNQVTQTVTYTWSE